jgi:hypothetical protein
MTNSPTFVARFADNEITRMTVHSSLTNLHMGRGLRLARYAYQSRMKCEPPAIVEAYFEHNGTRLMSYGAAALKAAEGAS